MVARTSTARMLAEMDCWRERMLRLGRSFAVALVLLAAVYLVGEMLSDESWAFIVTWPLITGAIVVILNATVASRRFRAAFVILAVSTYALGVAGLLIDARALEAPGSELPLLYAAGALALTLRHVMRRRRVTVDVVFGALSAYLLIGILFGFLYTGVAHADPDLFMPPQNPDETGGLFYFSFQTLTTIGYGDIAPAADWVRAIAVLEGLAGQVFLVALVARLVGMEIAQQRFEPTSPHDNTQESGPAICPHGR